MAQAIFVNKKNVEECVKVSGTWMIFCMIFIDSGTCEHSMKLSMPKQSGSKALGDGSNMWSSGMVSIRTLLRARPLS